MSCHIPRKLTCVVSYDVKVQLFAPGWMFCTRVDVLRDFEKVGETGVNC